MKWYLYYNTFLQKNHPLFRAWDENLSENKQNEQKEGCFYNSKNWQATIDLPVKFTINRSQSACRGADGRVPPGGGSRFPLSEWESRPARHQKGRSARYKNR